MSNTLDEAGFPRRNLQSPQQVGEQAKQTLQSIIGAPAPSPRAERPTAPKLDFDTLRERQTLPSCDNLPSVAGPLNVARSLNASDVHFISGHFPWMRIGSRFTADGSQQITVPSELTSIRQYAPEIGATIMVTCGRTRWRATFYNASDGLRSAFRRIDDTPKPFGMLGLNEDVAKVASWKDGLVLVAGGTGSGKSTTLAALVDLVNATREAHILTIENPVEYLITPKRSLISQQSVPEDRQVDSMLTALRSDPDVVMVGECRSASELSVCMNMAATGHLVLTTIHARDAAAACQRVIGAVGQEGATLLAQTLKLCLSQQLLPDMHDTASRHLIAEKAFIDSGLENLIAKGETNKVRQLLHSNQDSMDWELVRSIRADKISVEDACNAAIVAEQVRSILEM